MSNAQTSQATQASPTPQQVTITCADGVQLQGHFIAACGGQRADAVGLPVLISPATGVRQHFYLRFATWLAAQGHDVLVFDYRGIGLSLHGRLRDSRATLSEWGQLDQVAALTWLLTRTCQPQVMLVGHSAGGQMMGLLPNHHRIARVVGVATSTGWFKGMRPSFGIPAQVLLRGIVRLGIVFKGYGTCAVVGLGENLPAAVARQWGQWCAAGGYALNAVKHDPAQDFHAQVCMPITIFHASDDDIATTATVADLQRCFPAATHQVHRVTPRAHGLKAIGHIDWFRSSHQSLWPMLAAALHDPAPIGLRAR